MFDPFGFLPDSTGSMGSAFELCGIAGGILCSYLISKRPLYKMIGLTLSFMTLFTFVFVYFAMLSSSYLLLLTAVCINGFFNLSIFSVAYEYAVELTYPIGEAMS